MSEFTSKMINEMVDFTDIQMEVMEDIKKHVKNTNYLTVGLYNNLISTKNLIGGRIVTLKDLSFQEAIDNFLFNIEYLNETIELKEYNSYKERINKIKETLEEEDGLNLLLEINSKKLKLMDGNSFEYLFSYLKHYYDTLATFSKEQRWIRFYNFSKKVKLEDVMTIKEVSEKYEINIDSLRKFMNRGANGLTENLDYKKSGGTWLLAESGVQKYLNEKQ